MIPSDSSSNLPVQENTNNANTNNANRRLPPPSIASSATSSSGSSITSSSSSSASSSSSSSLLARFGIGGSKKKLFDSPEANSLIPKNGGKTLTESYGKAVACFILLSFKKNPYPTDIKHRYTEKDITKEMTKHTKKFTPQQQNDFKEECENSIVDRFIANENDAEANLNQLLDDIKLTDDQLQRIFSANYVVNSETQTVGQTYLDKATNKRIKFTMEELIADYKSQNPTFARNLVAHILLAKVIHKGEDNPIPIIDANQYKILEKHRNKILEPYKEILPQAVKMPDSVDDDIDD